jgi:hypothetical protein
MYKLKLRKIKRVDEYEAKDLLLFNTYESQRKIKPKHLKLLMEEIKTGNFLTGDIAIACLKHEDNRKIVVNGQHQLTAVMETSCEIDVVYQEYDCSTPEDVSELFRRFDNHQARTLSDCLNPEAVALGIDWKRSIVRLVVTAAYLKENLAGLSKVKKVELLKKYIRPGNFVNHLLKDGTSCRHLLRGSVVRAILETYEKDKDCAEIFWANIRDGVNLNKDCPELRLRDYLKGVVVGGAAYSDSVRCQNMSSSKEIYVKCIHAWNASRKGKPTNLKFVPSAPVPKIL